MVVILARRQQVVNMNWYRNAQFGTCANLESLAVYPYLKLSRIELLLSMWLNYILGYHKHKRSKWFQLLVIIKEIE